MRGDEGESNSDNGKPPQKQTTQTKQKGENEETLASTSEDTKAKVIPKQQQDDNQITAKNEKDTQGGILKDSANESQTTKGISSEHQTSKTEPYKSDSANVKDAKFDKGLSEQKPHPVTITKAEKKPASVLLVKPPPEVKVVPADSSEDVGQENVGSVPHSARTSISGEATLSASHAHGDHNGFSDTDDDMEEEECIFQPYTKEHYKSQKQRVEEERRKLEEKKNRVQEGRLVDGELIFDDEEGDEEHKIERDPGLVEGNQLPESFGKVPDNLINKPLDEIDTNLIGTVSTRLVLLVICLKI